MLSLFPEILFLSPMAPLLMRLTLAILLALCAWAHVSRTDTSSRLWAIAEVAAAAALFVGAWTQAVSLAVAAGILLGFFFPQTKVFPKSTMVLAIVMAVSLVVTGAGRFALDLPL